ncbi:DnaJ family domain-containing protein [Oerskovia jenensis]|uniref:DnaJ family domain-containing protein n=1 Tax=Oerskovia jenensis TaxID=162169 RepID=UPI0036D93B35
MTEDDPVRRAAQYRVDREAAQDAADAASAEADDDGAQPSGGPRLPLENRGQWVDELVRQAMARGEFDDLPLAGKPIPGLGARYDPDWWLKNLVERERITGILPPAQLRADDAGLRDELDRLFSEESVREALAEFNARVVDARRQLLGGPPVVTPLRDVEEEVSLWRERRAARSAASSAGPTAPRTSQDGSPRDRSRRAGDGSGATGTRRWWRRRRGGPADGTEAT